MDTRTQKVQELRRSGAACAIPARKPARRGGRGDRRRSAVRFEQRAHGR